MPFFSAIPTNLPITAEGVRRAARVGRARTTSRSGCSAARRSSSGIRTGRTTPSRGSRSVGRRTRTGSRSRSGTRSRRPSSAAAERGRPRQHPAGGGLGSRPAVRDQQGPLLHPEAARHLVRRAQQRAGAVPRQHEAPPGGQLGDRPAEPRPPVRLSSAARGPTRSCRPGCPGSKDAKHYPLEGVNTTSLNRAKALAQGSTRSRQGVLYTFNSSPGPALAQVRPVQPRQIGVDARSGRTTASSSTRRRRRAVSRSTSPSRGGAPTTRTRTTSSTFCWTAPGSRRRTTSTPRTSTTRSTTA